MVLPSGSRFRVLVDAASLKPVERVGDRPTEPAGFRVLVDAASLKRERGVDGLGRRLAPPRPRRRGLIEAKPRPPRRRARKRALPRPRRRGLIEATATSRRSRSPRAKLPRPRRRGLIEACNPLLAHLSGPEGFRVLVDAASLKHFGADFYPSGASLLPRPRRRGLIEAHLHRP